MVSKKTLNALLAGAVALTIAGAAVSANAEDAAATASADKEKCYGVVKAGKNDCAAAKSCASSTCAAHSCAGHSKADGAAGEWVALPAGVCDKLVGGSLTAPAADAPAEH